MSVEEKLRALLVIGNSVFARAKIELEVARRLPGEIEITLRCTSTDEVYARGEGGLEEAIDRCLQECAQQLEAQQREVEAAMGVCVAALR